MFEKTVNSENRINKEHKGIRKPFARILSFVLTFAMVIMLMPADMAFAEAKPSAVNLASCSSYTPLKTGVYYVDRNLTFNGYWFYGTGGLTIENGADVVIYIKEGCTLTCNGADAYIGYYEIAGNTTRLYSYPATAGITVPFNSKLTICGEGTLVAKGGNAVGASNGAKGGGGGFAWYCFPSWLGGGKDIAAFKGAGSAGGYGADSPAAAIGGNGVLGGEGGGLTGNWILGTSYDVLKLESIYCDSDGGKNGHAGIKGDSMGEVFITDTITVNATAGTRSNVFGAGSAKGESFADMNNGKFWSKNGDIIGTGGGGGGGGGLAGAAANIGGSGGSGGGGGAGARGVAASTKHTSSTGYTEAGSGTNGNADKGGDGGNGGAVKASDGKTYVSKGGVGGNAGKGGDGGHLYVSSGVKLNGHTGSVTEIGKGLTGAANTSGTEGQKAAVEGTVQVAVTINLNNADDVWCQSHTVTLCQNGQEKYTLRNEDIITGEVSSTYKTYIPESQSYTVYVDGLCIGNTISKNNTSCLVDAYTTNATVNLDNVGYSGRKVFLYRNDLFKYALNETAQPGVYSLNIFETVTGAAGENTYDVFIDDIDTLKDYNITSIEGAQLSFDYYNAQVTVLKDGVGVSEQSASLTQNDEVICNLAETSPGVYSKVLYCAPGHTENYDVFVNNENTGLELVAESADRMKGTVSYYGASISLNKDGAPWSGASVALINQNDSSSSIFLKGNNGVYSGMLTEQNGTYDLYIYGTGGSADTGVDISKENPVAAYSYYTVSFDKNNGGSQIMTTRLVREGTMVTEPVSPYVVGSTFEKWCSDAAGLNEFDFVYTPITAPTTIYATWLSPNIFIGNLIRCNASGEIDGGGDYYKMSNISITGFPRTGKKISALILDYDHVDIESINLSPVANISEISTSEKRTIIRFNELQTVADAENMARQLIIKPVWDFESPMTLTVYGKTDLDEDPGTDPGTTPEN